MIGQHILFVVKVISATGCRTGTKRHVYRVASPFTKFSDQVIYQTHSTIPCDHPREFVRLSSYISHSARAPAQMASASFPKHTPYTSSMPFELGGTLQKQRPYGAAKLAIAVVTPGARVVVATGWRGKATQTSSLDPYEIPQLTPSPDPIEPPSSSLAVGRSALEPW